MISSYPFSVSPLIPSTGSPACRSAGRCQPRAGRAVRLPSSWATGPGHLGAGPRARGRACEVEASFRIQRPVRDAGDAGRRRIFEMQCELRRQRPRGHRDFRVTRYSGSGRADQRQTFLTGKGASTQRGGPSGSRRMSTGACPFRRGYAGPAGCTWANKAPAFSDLADGLAQSLLDVDIENRRVAAIAGGR